MAEHKNIVLNDEEQMQADIICTRIAKGESLVHILEAPGMPEYHVVRNWLKFCDEFNSDFKLAKRDQAEYIYAEIQDIERRMKIPPYVTIEEDPTLDENGKKKKGRPSKKDQEKKSKVVANPEHLPSAVGQALIRSLQWRAERMNPENYGANKQTEDVDDGSLGDEILAARKRVGMKNDKA